MGGRRIFSFHELIELRFVSWCRENGVSMPVIRAAAQVAAELFQATHPFALDTFATDGHNIFALMREKRADLALGKNVLAVELPKFQLVFTSMIEPYFKDLDFEDHWANRWWPLGKDRRVVLDPARRFGEPIDGETGVPTNSLYQTYLAEDKDMSRVAWWYDVPVEAVAYAVDYEKLLAS
jgi:DNA-binding transcriptional MerR regulator